MLFITHSIPEAVFLADRVLVMTERPGAIAAIYDVPLPRPRSLDVMGNPSSLGLTQKIRKHFYSQGTLDALKRRRHRNELATIFHHRSRSTRAPRASARAVSLRHGHGGGMLPRRSSAYGFA